MTTAPYFKLTRRRPAAMTVRLRVQFGRRSRSLRN